MLCIAEDVHFIVFILVEVHVVILSLPTRLLGRTVLPDAFFTFILQNFLS